MAACVAAVIPAEVGNGARVHRPTLSHLTAGTYEELRELVDRPGPRREWFQPARLIGRQPSRSGITT